MEAGVLEAKGVLVAYHGVGLASAGGSVGEDGGVESVEYCFDERVCCFEIDLNVGEGTF